LFGPISTLCIEGVEVFLRLTFFSTLPETTGKLMIQYQPNCYISPLSRP